MKIKFFERILDVIFPKHIKCLVCGNDLPCDTKYCICDKCMAKLPFITGSTCGKCGVGISDMGKYCISCKNNPHVFSKNLTIFTYDPPISTMIKSMKFAHKKYISYTFSNFIASKVIESGIHVDMVCPVPMHPSRLKKRGYNHASLLCDALVKLKFDVREDVLVKKKETATQASLHRADRLKNLEGSFGVSDKKAVKNKTILIVDDVMTTGATLDECAQALLDAGAFKVYTITLSHATNK